jgi:hypothetical protein
LIFYDPSLGSPIQTALSFDDDMSPPTATAPLGSECDLTAYRIAKHDDFAHWIAAMCVVGFDIELGAVVESVFPDPQALSAADRKAISYLSFPDCNSSFVGDTLFCFRFESTDCPPFLYGFVCFRQQPDPSAPRGFFQKASFPLPCRTRLISSVICGPDAHSP